MKPCKFPGALPRLLPALLPATLLLSTSCTTEVVPDPVPDAPEAVDATVRVRVTQNDFTRSVGDEDAVGSLWLGFYASAENGPELQALVKATADDDEVGTYKAAVTAVPGSYPDMLVAFANIDDEEAMNNALSATPSAISGLPTATGESSDALVMSSALYFDTGDTPLAHSPLLLSHFTGGEPVEVYLERCAAKVTLKLKDGLKVDFAAREAGKEVTLKLIIDGWGLTATDAETHLVKQLCGRNDLDEELATTGEETPWWIPEEEHKVSWAHSVNWGKTAEEYPEYGSDLTNSFLSHISYKEASTDPGTAQYCHETTRPAEVFDAPNALPSVVIAGHYTLGDGVSPATFYRFGSTVFNTEEYWEAMAAAQTVLYKNDGGTVRKLTAEELQAACTDATPTEAVADKPVSTSLVTPQLKEGVTPAGYTDASGKPYETVQGEDVNKALLASCQLMEKYLDGKCVFTVPVAHSGKKDTTGSYGIVRNHHYSVTVASIEGFGRGVTDLEARIADAQKSDISDSYTVTANIHIVGWTEVEQEIEIKE